METRTINVNGKDYTFINAYRKNHGGFVHECELHIGYQVFDAKIRYYNRTWEPYTYQTVMVEALYKYSDYVKTALKEKFLNEKGKQRMSPALKAEFEKFCTDNQQLRDIAQVRNELDCRTWC